MIQRLFLWGMPGSGKTTLGKKMSARLNLPFFDLDDIIEEEKGATISDIFTRKGESYFRELERQFLRKFCNKEKRFILATGGGTPCYYDNADFMNLQGTSIFLQTEIKELARRLNDKQIQHRPLLAEEKDLKVTLEKKLLVRKKHYQKAQIVVDQTFDGISDNLDEICRRLE